jgi:hypothetical protein
MARCRIDTSLERTVIDGFAFPLGVYPVEEMTPREGYTVWFEPADDGDSMGGLEGVGESSTSFGEDDEDEEGGEWEEWPDRYVFDIAITATRVEPLFRALFALLPGRIFPILDVLGHDAYREVDSLVSYDLIGQERFMDAIRRFRGFFFEDGLVGFGAMSEEPFIYIFVDEHKLITVRVETALKEKVEQVLATFDLQPVDEIAGADSVAHEHRGVLDAPPDRPDLLTHEEIIEELIDEWNLVLNVPPDTNKDEEGNDLGITGWRAIVRWEPPPPRDPESGEGGSYRERSGGRYYAEILLTAGSLRAAEDLAAETIRSMVPAEELGREGEEEETGGRETFLSMDRLRPEDLREALASAKDESGSTPTQALPEPPFDEEKVWRARWLE